MSERGPKNMALRLTLADRDKEIKDLKNQLKEEKKAYINMYNMYVEIKDRNEKAIEYLESYNTDFKHSRFNEAPISIRELGDLLDILKGSDKE